MPIGKLVLTRKPGERVFIGDNITVKVVQIKGNQVRLMFCAPEEIGIFREEVYGYAKESEESGIEA